MAFKICVSISPPLKRLHLLCTQCLQKLQYTDTLSFYLLLFSHTPHRYLSDENAGPLFVPRSIIFACPILTFNMAHYGN